jgi:stage II sporulation protein D
MARRAALIVLLLAASAEAADLRVRLFSRTPNVSGKPAKPGFYPPGLKLNGVVIDEPVELTKDGKIIAHLSLEHYVASVLPGETNGFRSDEALRAMAVAIRTYALHFRHAHAREGFDLCDTTHCQDVRISARTARHLAAAEDTEGQLLWWKGKPAATYYHAHCGGHTESSISGPYLTAHEDPWCPRTEWRRDVTPDSILAGLRAAGLPRPAQLTTIQVAARNDSGRVTKLDLSGVLLGGLAFRRVVPDILGTNFTVESVPGAFRFRGVGRGHGVGLCQLGAEAMGAQGKSMREILAFYYPGTQLGLTASGLEWTYLRGERVELLTTRRDADLPLLTASERALQSAESVSGLLSPVKPQVRIYPDNASYRNSTAHGAAARASTRGRVIRLSPSARATLASTLRHEMLHVVLEANRRVPQPTWFREDLVRALNGEPAPRVARLIRAHGKDQVMAWWRSGLPAAAKSPTP